MLHYFLNILTDYHDFCIIIFDIEYMVKPLYIYRRKGDLESLLKQLDLNSAFLRTNSCGLFLHSNSIRLIIV